MSTRCCPAACSLAVYSRSGSGGGPVGRSLSSHSRSVLRRVPSSGVGTTANGSASARSIRLGGWTDRCRAHCARRRPVRAPAARPRARTGGWCRDRRCRAGSALMPVVRVSSASCSAQSRADPAEETAAGTELPVDVVEPADVGGRSSGRHSGVVDHRAQLGQRVGIGVAHARQPAVGRRRRSAAASADGTTRSRSRPGAPAPGPAATSAGSPRSLRPARRPPRRALRRAPPIAAIASQNAPAPRPSSTRPLLRMSSEATLRASTAGKRSGRFATFGATRTDEVCAAITESSVQVSRNRFWYG